MNVLIAYIDKISTNHKFNKIYQILCICLLSNRTTQLMRSRFQMTVAFIEKLSTQMMKSTYEIIIALIEVLASFTMMSNHTLGGKIKTPANAK